MHKWLMAVIICFISEATLAQTVSGIIQDKLTLEPLQGAVINYNGHKVLSGRDGHFSIAAKAGATPLIISMVGYKKDTIQLTDSFARLEVNMHRLSKMLDDIVVTGTMKAVLKSASPVPVEVYTPQFFRRNPTPS